MIMNNILFRDFETGSRNPATTQPTQLAAVAIDPKSMEIIPDSIYETMIMPEWDEEKCLKAGIDPIEDGALNVCNFTKDSFKDAIEPKIAWKDYCNYLKRFNLKGESGGSWDAPHVAGFNSSNFDDIIDLKMCEKYGPKPGDRGINIYQPIVRFDILPIYQMVFNNLRMNPANKFSMDSFREYMGMDTEYAHRADFDILQGAFMYIKLLRLFRGMTDGTINLPRGKKVKFHDCFEKENIIIKGLLT